MATAAHNQHVEPTPRLRRAIKNHAAAQLTLERARAELHQAIVSDLDAGVRQAELARLTGYTRERIRQITRAHTEEHAS